MRRPRLVGVSLLASALVAWHVGAATRPIVADVDGDGDTDAGLWDDAQARALLDSTHDGKLDGITPALGLSSDVPFFGDWDGDGVETLALYRRSSNQVIWTNNNNKDGVYFVRSVVAVAGAQGIPIRGDWDGNGVDGFAIYDVTTRNFDFYQGIATPRIANRDAGNVGDIPIAGDWNGDGSEGFALYRPATRDFWLFETYAAATPASFVPSVGDPGDIPLAGKWQGRSNWSIGLYRPATRRFFLYDTPNLAALQTIVWLDPASVVATQGRQSSNISGVPHARLTGGTRTTYDAADSFLLLGIYGVGGPLNELDENIFLELQAAGFNAAQLWPSISIPEALTASNGSNIRLIPRFSSADLTVHDSNPQIFGWYVWDEPSGATTLAALQNIYGTYGPSASRFMFHTITPPNGDPNWSSIAALGHAGAIDDYPIHLPAQGTLTIESIANSTNALRAARSPATPIWFVPQAFASNNPGDSWDMPATNPDQYRAMVYASFIHGASGLISFARDGYVMRSGGCLGISPHPIDSYPGCTFGTRLGPRGEPVPKACDIPSSAAKAKSQALWNAVAQLNAELTSLRPALLSPTSAQNYTVDLLQTPNNGAAPIRTLLKTSPTETYLIAVNMINDNLDAVIQLNGAVSSVAVQFENRSVATPLGAIRDRFGPFAVHIYKF